MMLSALKQVSRPVGELVPLDRVKAHLRVDGPDEDGLIGGYLLAAVGLAENHTRRCFLPRPMLLSLFGHLPATGIDLPTAPVQAVDSVVFEAVDGEETVIPAASYRSILDGDMALVLPVSRWEWPGSSRAGRVKVAFTAGYASADDVPGDIIAAVLLLVGHLYANREGVIVGTIASELPLGVSALLAPHVFKG
ncbi:head-tail connector protein [Azospirillum argentinense]